MGFHGGSTFSPLSINDLAQWYDAADTSTISEVANAVTQWDDKSGNANHATQAVAVDQPLTNQATINGLNTITFDGTDFLEVPFAPEVNSINPTVFTVVRFTGVISAPAVLTNILGPLVTTGGMIPFVVSTFFLALVSSETTGLVAGAASVQAPVSGTPYIYGIRHNPTTPLTEQFIDGILDGSAGVTDIDFITNRDMHLGGFTVSTTTNRMIGDIGEIIIYDRTLTNAEQDNLVNNYLKPKWGIT